MRLPRAFRALVAREEFYPGIISFFTSPYFITRYHLLRSIRSYAPRLGGELLDFGCGSKPYERLFTNVDAYIGVDVEVSGHDHTTSRVDNFYDGKALPFPAGRFDSIVSFEVFEHVENLEAMVDELFRVAKPGAFVLVTMPFVFPEHETPFDFRRLTRYGLNSLLQKGGFEILENRTTCSSVLTLAQCFSHLIFRELTPQFTLAKIFTQLFVAVPLTMVAYLLDFLLPRKDSLYINLVVLARKPAVSTASG